MRNLLWYLIPVFGLATAFLLSSPYMAFALYTFLLLLLVAHLSSNAWLSGLVCVRTISGEIFQQGDEIQITVELENQRGWPIPWIFIEDHCPPGCHRIGAHQRLAFLLPGRKITLSYALLASRRGYHRAGPLLMESGDLFGLQKRFRSATQRDYFSVLPTVAYIDTFNIATRRPQGPVRLSNRIYEDPTRINNIREYVPGDPLNTIHWKATARTGKLHVKTHEPSSVLGATLVLDLHDESFLPEGREERMELAITTAASIAHLLQMSGEQLGLVTNARDAAEVARWEVEGPDTLSRAEADDQNEGEDPSTRISPLSVETRRSPIQAQRIAENLARVLPGDGIDVIGLLLAAFQQLPRDAALLPIVPQIDLRLVDTLATLKHAGFSVTVFLIKDLMGYEEGSALLAAEGIHCFHIEHERHLHEISPARIGR